jgi:hypothetical protein
MVIVVILPLSEFVVEQVDVIADAVLVEQLIKLLVINAVRALDFTVETRRSWSDIHVPDVLRLKMPVEFRLELSTVIGLDYEHSERQAAEHFVDEPDGGALVAGVVDLQDPNAGAIVDGCELIEAAARPGNSFQELHIQLQSVTRLWLLIALPPFPVRSVFLIRRQAVQAMPLEDAMH